jgi:hypothetical protein
MPIARGHMVKTGWKKGVTYGTPVAVGAGDGLIILSESLKADVPRIDDTSMFGDGQLRGADVVGKRFAGPLAQPARYEGRWLTMLASLLGTAGVPSGANPYTHTFKPAADPSGVFGTLVLDKQVAIWEFDSAHVDTLTLRSEAGSGENARARTEFGLIARSLDLASAVNTSTQINALTIPTAGHLLHHHLTVRMNANGGAGLGSGDVLKARRIELTVKNNYRGDFFFAGAQLIDTPIRNGFMEITGTILLDKYSLNTPGVTEFLAGTYMKMDLVWTTGASAIVKLELPYCQILGGDRDAASPAVIENPIPFKCYKPTAAPTGMTTTDSLWIFVTNTQSGDFLA